MDDTTRAMMLDLVERWRSAAAFRRAEGQTAAADALDTCAAQLVELAGVHPQLEPLHLADAPRDLSANGGPACAACGEGAPIVGQMTCADCAGAEFPVCDLCGESGDDVRPMGDALMCAACVEEGADIVRPASFGTAPTPAPTAWGRPKGATDAPGVERPRADTTANKQGERR
jgi:hypothetical protein